MPERITVARIRDLGAANGMLIFEKYEDFCELAERLLDAGYGFSVLDEPGQQEEFDLQSFEEMFADWGWSGERHRKPSWMQ